MAENQLHKIWLYFIFFFGKAEKQFRKSGLSIESVGNNLVVEIGSSNLTVAFFFTY